MTREQRELLERHAEHFEAMASYVRECDPEEQEALYQACLAATTAIAWSAYQAAQFLKGEIEFVRRTSRR